MSNQPEPIDRIADVLSKVLKENKINFEDGISYWTTDAICAGINRLSDTMNHYLKTSQRGREAEAEMQQRVIDAQSVALKAAKRELARCESEARRWYARLQELKATISKTETVAEFTACENAFDELIFVEKGKYRGDRYVWGKDANHYKKGDKLYLQTRMEEAKR